MTDMNITVTSSNPLGDDTFIEQTTSYWITPPEQPWIFDLPREADGLDDDD